MGDIPVIPTTYTLKGAFTLKGTYKMEGTFLTRTRHKRIKTVIYS
jgi:hypothetical protein